MPLNNPGGKNGWGEKQYPPDDILKASLLQYAKERLSIPERLLRLKAEHGLCIKKTKLKELNNKFDIPSVRKPIPDDVATAAVLRKVAEDRGQVNGVGTIATLLSNEGVVIARKVPLFLVSIDLLNCLAARFPGGQKVHRSALHAIGPWHQDHSDGHDKLNAQALKMGDVALPIYGIRDQWSGLVKHLVTVPDNRLATTIGHVHLDCIETYHVPQAVPVTSVMDKGSELGYLFGQQTALRTTYAPEIDIEVYPPVVQVKSTHNTPIEGLWHWLLKTSGHDFREVVRSGLSDGIYQINNPAHINLFKWLWPQILQRELNKFTEYWNNHRIRYQADKPNVSGVSPRQAFTCPNAYNGEDCKIEVDQQVIDALRREIPVPRKEAMRWVSDEFAEVAQAAYEHLGSPEMSPQAGWAIFSAMAIAILA
ncbi:hypothetical protein H0H93_009076 [Arthromyces matolae]|nr:hypothetical protein H0H93_009076 [Arthromyces matolae]